MLGAFLSYFVIFFIVATLVSLTGKMNWISTLKTTPRHDALLSIILFLILQ